jgi:hypothetical protein
MTATRNGASVSRRTAVAGLGAGGLGLALAATTRQASAQEATPYRMVGHPMVGTWIVDKDVDSTTDVPSVVVYTADGGLLDPSESVAGAWQATGPRSAAWTLVDFLTEGPAGYVVVRSTGEVNEGGNTLDSPYSVTVVGADGTVLPSGQGLSRYSRLPIEPIEAGGTPLAGFPTWTPAPAADATPTS